MTVASDFWVCGAKLLRLTARVLFVRDEPISASFPRAHITNEPSLPDDYDAFGVGKG